MYSIWKIVEAGNPECQDRVEVIRSEDRIVIVIADGAGGLSGGAEAADMVVRAVRDFAERETRTDAAACSHLLRSIDQAIQSDSKAGETTAVVAILKPNEIIGASVGDSGVWLIEEGEHANLTRHQRRKPFLGTGMAMPVTFSARVVSGSLLFATDGLLKYTSAEKICEVLKDKDPENIVRRLVELVRLRSGGLPDDVAIVLCR
jgi:serine/threonine protein phosphatase PrpC